MDRSVRIHCFFSVKGGVGKTTLAVALAQLVPRPERCVVLDLDLTGSSLAEGLDLQAPEIALRSDGSMDLDAPPTGTYLSVDESRTARDARKRSKAGLWLPPPYINDAFRYEGNDQERDCRLDAMCWRHQSDPGVRYLPSSSIDRDIVSSLDWLYRDEVHHGGAWLQRFAWILYTFLEQMPELEDLVLDMPPGVFGFTREVLSFLAHLSTGSVLPARFPGLPDQAEWQIHPYLVTSEDRQDLFLAMETYATILSKLPSVVPLLNRLKSPIEKTKEALDQRFRGALIKDIGHRMRSVSEHRATLGRLFIEGDLKLTDTERKELQVLFEVRG
jgi:hypothetical protein